LLWSIALTGLVGKYWVGFTWDDLYEGIADSLLMGLQAILILFVIYALIATWVSAGTIPGLMYYGLAVLTRDAFLPATALLAAVVAFSIGSSWTTAGTLGVAFIGIGSGLGIPAPMTACAILTGAYAGDKQSPLSDTTNLAAAVTDTDLYDHIRAMRNGTAVAFGLSVLLYAALGLRAGGAIPAGRVAEIQGALAGTYDLSVLVFLPLAVTFGLALYGFPALPTLVAGVFAGTTVTTLVQGRSFTDAWAVFLSGSGPETGVGLVNDLLASGGLSGSAWTVSVVVAALSLGGLLERTGVLAVLPHPTRECRPGHHRTRRRDWRRRHRGERVIGPAVHEHRRAGYDAPEPLRRVRPRQRRPLPGHRVRGDADRRAHPVARWRRLHGQRVRREHGGVRAVLLLRLPLAAGAFRHRPDRPRLRDGRTWFGPVRRTGSRRRLRVSTGIAGELRSLHRFTEN